MGMDFFIHADNGSYESKEIFHGGNWIFKKKNAISSIKKHEGVITLSYGIYPGFAEIVENTKYYYDDEAREIIEKIKPYIIKRAYDKMKEAASANEKIRLYAWW